MSREHYKLAGFVSLAKPEPPPNLTPFIGACLLGCYLAALSTFLIGA